MAIMAGESCGQFLLA
jgi:hypothetical protein